MKRTIFILVIIILFVNFFNFKDPMKDRTDFSECTFKELCSYSKKYPYKRKYIVEPLIEKKEFKQLTKADVINILGNPSKEWPDQLEICYEYERKDFYILEYTLFVYIDFDKNNKVLKAHIFVIDH